MFRLHLFLFFFISLNLSAQKMQIEKLNAKVNTPQYNEISPVVSRDGKTLYYTIVAHPNFNRTLLLNGSDVSQTAPAQYDAKLREAYADLSGTYIDNPTNSVFNQDIWVAESVDDYFDYVHHPGTPLNNALPNSICALTPEPDEFIVINQFKKEGGMSQGFSSTRLYADGTWSFPKPIFIGNYYTQSEEVNFTMSTDGEVLILSVEREDSFGSNDLYVSFKESEQKWSAPKNLGIGVNSLYRETTPQLSEDKKTLYFSSNRPGLGGNDIYSVKRLDDSWKNWSTASLFKSPINSSADDSQPYFNAATGFLYFTSTRDGTSDIFRVGIKDPEPQTEITVKGRIINSVTKDIIPAKLFFGPAAAKNYKSFYASVDGTFRMKIPKGEKYKFIAQKEGFFAHPHNLMFKKDFYYFKDYLFDLILDPMELNAQISVEPIYFERSKALILRKSFDALDGLADLLKEYPSMEILVEGHTDSNGKANELRRLSEDRAKAVREYLINEGIDVNRIESIGLGGSKPVTANDSEESRSKNRRVDVRVTKLDETQGKSW
ncbi:MAG: hypothetical protein ACI85O_002607 [Saprospiraceae bacterium]|jgi:hypothetical protein